MNYIIVKYATQPNYARARAQAAAMALLRYHRMGLVSRFKLKGSRTRVYSLTKKGQERLDWLRQPSVF